MVERFDALDRTLVAAFDDRRVRWLRRRLGPRACTVAGIAEVSALRITGWTPSGANATQIPIRRYGIPLATPGFVRRAHARRLAVHVWTIDDAPEMERLLDLGADGIMTDRPSVLKDVLQQRGAWFYRAGGDPAVRSSTARRRRARRPRSPRSTRPASAALTSRWARSRASSTSGVTAAASSPISWRMIRSVREATIGSGMPSTHTPSPPTVTALVAAQRLEGEDPVRAGELAEAEGHHARFGHVPIIPDQAG